MSRFLGTPVPPGPSTWLRRALAASLCVIPAFAALCWAPAPAQAALPPFLPVRAGSFPGYSAGQITARDTTLIANLGHVLSIQLQSAEISSIVGMPLGADFSVNAWGAHTYDDLDYTVRADETQTTTDAPYLTEVVMWATQQSFLLYLGPGQPLNAYPARLLRDANHGQASMVRQIRAASTTDTTDYSYASVDTSGSSYQQPAAPTFAPMSNTPFRSYTTPAFNTGYNFPYYESGYSYFHGCPDPASVNTTIYPVSYRPIHAVALIALVGPTGTANAELRTWGASYVVDYDGFFLGEGTSTAHVTGGHTIISVAASATAPGRRASWKRADAGGDPYWNNSRYQASDWPPPSTGPPDRLESTSAAVWVGAYSRDRAVYEAAKAAIDTTAARDSFNSWVASNTVSPWPNVPPGPGSVDTSGQVPSDPTSWPQYWWSQLYDAGYALTWPMTLLSQGATPGAGWLPSWATSNASNGAGYGGGFSGGDTGGGGGGGGSAW